MNKANALFSSALATLVMACFVPAVVAQDGGGDDFNLMRFSGGTVSADFRLGFSMSGSSLGSASWGGVMSGKVHSGAAEVFLNPATMAQLEARQLIVDGQVGIGTWMSSGTGHIPQADIESALDDVFSDFNYPDSAPRNYTQFQALNLGLQRRLPSMAYAVPIGKRTVLSAGVENPASTSFSLQAAGLEAYFSGQSGSEDAAPTRIDALLSIGMAAQLQLRMSTMAIGFGHSFEKMGPGVLRLGAALTRHRFRTSLGIDVNPTGMMVLNQTKQYLFNDPDEVTLATDETNVLYLRANGNYADTQWGARLGMAYALPSGKLGISLLYTAAPTFTMSDPNAFVESYIPTFVNMDGSPDAAEGEEELIAIDNVDIAKPTLTKRTTDTLGQEMRLSLPSSITLGIDLGLGKHTLALNLVQYLSEMSAEFEYGDARRFGKDLGTGLRVGMDFQFPDRLRGAGFALIPIRLLFLDIDGLLLQALGRYSGYANPHYRLGGGLAMGAAIVEGVEDPAQLEDTLSLPFLTGFSLGRSYTLRQNLQVGVLVFGMPDVAYRFSLAYIVR